MFNVSSIFLPSDSLSSSTVSPPMDSYIFFRLADETERYSGADIEFICKKAVQNVFMEVIKTGNKLDVSMDDLLQVISQYRRLSYNFQSIHSI